MKISTIEGLVTTVFGVLTGGAFLTGYAMMLGANEFIIAIIGALPFISQIFQLFGSYLLALYVRPRKIVFLLALIHRSIWGILIFLPFLEVSSKLKLAIFISVVALSSFLATAVANLWTSWISEIIPSQVRGRYFGIRTAYMSIVNMAIFILCALILDHFKRTDIRVGFALIHTFTFLSAVIGSTLFLYHPDVEIKVEREKFFSSVLAPLKDASFRRYVLFFAQWNFSIGLSAPFFQYHMLKNLHMSFTQISVLNFLTVLLNVVFFRWWGGLMDRFGAKNILLFNASTIAYIPALWLFATPKFLLPVFYDAILTGIAWSGFNLSAFTIPISKPPAEKRSHYVAVLSIASGFSYFVSSLLAGALASEISDFSVEIFGIRYVNLHILFLLSLLGRLVSTYILTRIPEPEESKFIPMVESISSGILRTVSIIGSIVPIHKTRNASR